MNQKLILAFTGRIASGKGTAANYFVERYGAQAFRFSTPLRDVLDRLYLEQHRENLQEVSRILREHFGQDLLARVIARDVADVDSDIVVVDGVRRPLDVEYLRQISGFKLIALEAAPPVRYERLRKRGENPDDAKKTWEEFLQEEGAETESLLGDVMGQADFIIDNNEGDAETLRQKVEELYQKLINEIER